MIYMFEINTLRACYVRPNMSATNLDELIEPYARGRVATECLHHPRRLRRVQRATDAGAQTYGRGGRGNMRYKEREKEREREREMSGCKQSS